MIGTAIYTGIIAFIMLFLVMILLDFSVKWMYVLSILEKNAIRKLSRTKTEKDKK